MSTDRRGLQIRDNTHNVPFLKADGVTDTKSSGKWSGGQEADHYGLRDEKSVHIDDVLIEID